MGAGSKPGRPRTVAVSLLVGAAVFVVAWAGLSAANSGRKPSPAFPRSALRPALLANETVRTFLEGRHWTSLRPVPLDERTWRVTVLDGQRALVDANVGPQGQVSTIATHPQNRVPYGSQVLWAPAVLALFTVAFWLAVAIVPLRSARNLDAAVIALGFLAEMLLYKNRLVAPHIAVAAVVLAYIAVRGTRIALTPSGHQPPVRALLAWLGGRVGATAPRRMGRFMFIAVAATGVLLIFTATGISDIALVNLAGATLITHGQLPYGAFPPELGHGDTYPLLSYVLFVPGALLSPVSDVFDDLQTALDINAVAYVAAAALLFGAARRYAGKSAGLVAAAAWLAFPAVIYAASTGGNDVPTALFVALALFSLGRPAWSAAALALAGWTKVIPAAALITSTAAIRGRPLARAAVGGAAVCAAGAIALVVLGSTHGPADMLNAMRFQTERGSLHSVWWQLDALGAQRVFEAATLAYIAAIATAIALRPELQNLRTAAAASASSLALVQLAGNYWNTSYLAWLMPFVVIGFFLARLSPGDAPPAVTGGAKPAEQQPA